MNKIIEIELVRNEKTRINGWELSSFISKINTYSYKIALMEEIEKEIQKGVSPEDILILDNSFKINNIYEVMDKINLSSEQIVKLFYIGKPVGIVPSTYIFNLSILFEFIENMRQKYKKHGFKMSNTKEILARAYSFLKQNKITDTFDFVFKIMLEEVEVKNYEKAKIDYENIKKKISLKVFEFNENIQNINSVKNQISNDETSLKTNKYTKPLFDRFSYLINHLVRPVVLVLNRETNIARVLCKGQINKRKKDADFFEYKKYEHINPDFLTLGFPVVLGAGINKILNLEKDKLEKDKLKKEIKLLDKKIETEEAKQLTEKLLQEKLKIENIIDNQNKLLRVDDEKVNKENAVIINKYIQHKIDFNKDKINNNMEKLVTGNKFKIEKIDIKG